MGEANGACSFINLLPASARAEDELFLEVALVNLCAKEECFDGIDGGRGEGHS